MASTVGVVTLRPRLLKAMPWTGDRGAKIERFVGVSGCPLHYPAPTLEQGGRRGGEGRLGWKGGEK